MWKELHKVGVTNETVLALDFSHFGSSQEGIESLAKQLSENYEIKVVSFPRFLVFQQVGFMLPVFASPDR